MISPVLNKYYRLLAGILQDVMPKAVVEEGATTDWCDWFPSAFEQIRVLYVEMALQMTGSVWEPTRVWFSHYGALSLLWRNSSVDIILAFDGETVEYTKCGNIDGQVFSSTETLSDAVLVAQQLVELATKSR